MHRRLYLFALQLFLQVFVLELADEELGEDDVFVLESIAEAKKSDEDKLRVTLLLTLRDTIPALAKVIRIIEVSRKTISNRTISTTCCFQKYAISSPT